MEFETEEQDENILLVTSPVLARTSSRTSRRCRTAGCRWRSTRRGTSAGSASRRDRVRAAAGNCWAPSTTASKRQQRVSRALTWHVREMEHDRVARTPHHVLARLVGRYRRQASRLCFLLGALHVARVRQQRRLTSSQLLVTQLRPRLRVLFVLNASCRNKRDVTSDGLNFEAEALPLEPGREPDLLPAASSGRATFDLESPDAAAVALWRDFSSEGSLALLWLACEVFDAFS